MLMYYTDGHNKWNGYIDPPLVQMLGRLSKTNESWHVARSKKVGPTACGIAQ